MLILGIVSKVKVFKNIHTYDSISSSCYSSHAKSCCRCFKSLNGVHLCWIQLIWKGTHLFKLTEFKLTEYIWSLYEVSQLTVEVRVQTPGKEMKRNVFRHKSGERCWKLSVTLKVPMSSSVSIIWNGRSLKPPGLFLEHPGHLHWGEWAQDEITVRAGIPLWRENLLKRTTISATIHLSDLHGRLAR